MSIASKLTAAIAIRTLLFCMARPRRRGNWASILATISPNRRVRRISWVMRTARCPRCTCRPRHGPSVSGGSSTGRALASPFRWMRPPSTFWTAASIAPRQGPNPASRTGRHFGAWWVGARDTLPVFPARI